MGGTQPHDRPRVFAVDDHTLFLRGLEMLLESAGLHVTGTATTGEQALECIDIAETDVVLLDVALPSMSGLEVAVALRARGFIGAIVFLTMTDDGVTVRRAIEAGADGFVLKGADEEELLGAILAAYRGDTVLDAFATRALIEGIRARGVRHDNPIPTDLTSRELEVLDLMVQGHDNARIACALRISVNTVKHHVSAVLRKLQARSRSEAVVAAIRGGIVDVFKLQ